MIRYPKAAAETAKNIRPTSLTTTVQCSLSLNIPRGSLLRPRSRKCMRHTCSQLSKPGIEVGVRPKRRLLVTQSFHGIELCSLHRWQPTADAAHHDQDKSRHNQRCAR